MTSSLSHSDTPLADLLVGLRRARRLLALSATIRAILLGLAAGLLVYCVLAALLLSGFETVAPLAAAMPIGLAVFAVALLMRLIGLPSLDRIGIDADRALGSHEQIRTALDVRSKDLSQPLSRLLLRDTGALGEQLDPRTLVPQFGWALPSLVLALAVAAILLSQVAPAARPAQPSAELTASEQAFVAAQLEDIALTLREEALERESQYLQAVARELDQLGTMVSTGERTGRADILEDIARLQSHAASAMTNASDTSADAPSAALDQLANLGERVAFGDAPLPAPPDLPTPAEPDEPQASSQPRDAAGEREPSDDHPQSDMEAVASGVEATPRRRNLPIDGMEVECEIDIYEGCVNPIDINVGPGDSMMAMEPLQTLGSPSATEDAPDGDGLLIGPSDESGRGDSTEAGLGSEELFGPDTLATLFELREFLDLDSGPIVEGATASRSDMVPQANDAELSGEALEGSTAWRKQPESPVAHGSFPPGQRDLLTRYFSRPVGD